jgi:hypothetical protein
VDREQRRRRAFKMHEVYKRDSLTNDSAITHNTLAASPGITVQGGGLFTLLPVTLTNSLIAGNVPDQCSGC